MIRKHWLAVVLSCAFSMVFFLAVFYLSETTFSDVRSAFFQAGFSGLSLVVSTMIGQLLLQSISWSVLLHGSGYRMSFAQATSAIFIGWVANFATPSMYLGGEPVRAYALAKSSGLPFRKALGSVFAHKFLEFTSFLLFILASLGIALYEFHDVLHPHLKAVLITGALLLSVLFAGLIAAIGCRKHFFSSVARGLIHCKIAPVFLRNNTDKIADVDDIILDAFFNNFGHCLHSLLWLILFHALSFIRPAVFFIFLGIPLGLGKLSLLFLMIQMLFAFQITPGSLGVFEGGMIGILSLVGIASAPAVGFATFCRVGDLSILSIGLALPLYYGLTHQDLSTIKQQAG